MLYRVEKDGTIVMTRGQENLVHIPIEKKGMLEGDLQIPPGAKGLILFAHGSGSSRHSPRNRYVAEVLREGGLATLLIDLLTQEEEVVDDVTAALRFDIAMLTDRLCEVTKWLKAAKEAKTLRIGYFGASTGAAAALCAAAEMRKEISAVVSRGGRPDLAKAALSKVEAPTLLIVGGYDLQVITMNEEAYVQLKCEKKMIIVPRATHLFEEEGALEEVARLGLDWFHRYLGAS